jgi:hypothetical protein
MCTDNRSLALADDSAGLANRTPGQPHARPTARPANRTPGQPHARPTARPANVPRPQTLYRGTCDQKSIPLPRWACLFGGRSLAVEDR